MDLNPGQLDALVAIAEHGSFEAAARELHITPSAVSQRIRALEAAAGQVLVSRGAPCRPTPHGERLVRLGRQTRLLYDEASAALAAPATVELPVAVNADSLATWFRDVLAAAAAWDATAVRVHVDDQAYSHKLLRSGDVLAAVTSDRDAVQGCSVEPLGSLRYVPAATPAFADRWRRGHAPDWTAMPVVVFNDKDELQWDMLRRRGTGQAPPVAHRVPSSADFLEAVRVGLGWGMVPEPQARDDLAAGRLAVLSADVVDVPLFWQRWRLDSPRLATLTGAVRAAARKHLLRPLDVAARPTSCAIPSGRAHKEMLVTTVSAAEGSQAVPIGPPPPFDAELAPALAEMAERRTVEFTLEAIPLLRQGPGPLPPVTDDDLRRGGAFEVSSRLVPGPAGAPEVPLLVCRPAAAATPVAALYHIHGGGMILGDNRVGMPGMLDLAEQFRLAVVSVEYRLAPETPHPGPAEDCYAGLVWCAAHAGELGIDPERIIVAGGSAGGGLSAAVALIARDRGGPALAGQLLICPMLDDRNDTPSSWQMAGLGIWDHAANEVGWTALLGSARGGPDLSPYAAPARAADLSGLPPAFIDVGSAETFRDEDVAYATRIWQAGGEAELHVWPGGFHGFTGAAPQAALSRDARAAQAGWLRRVLGSRDASAGD